MLNKQNNDFIYQIIKTPYFTSKSYAIQSHNYKTFRVASTANKAQIKEAVEKLFDVKVAHVRTCSVRGQVRFFKGKKGYTKSWKKAYVKLQTGFDIQFTAEEGV